MVDSLADDQLVRRYVSAIKSITRYLAEGQPDSILGQVGCAACSISLVNLSGSPPNSCLLGLYLTDTYFTSNIFWFALILSTT